MLNAFIDGIGVWGPGLEGWVQTATALSAPAGYVPHAPQLPSITLLPPAERRRISPTIKLALAVAHEAVLAAEQDASMLAAIFSSSGGDGDTIHAILEALTTPAREVSPTKFHNSVHNAPSGYWALATQCREPSTTLCAHDFSFAAGLWEAVTQMHDEHRAVLAVSYDKSYPEPLHSTRPIEGLFAVALVLAPTRGPRSIAQLAIAPSKFSKASVLSDPALERLRLTNPAARSLPLLQSLALGSSCDLLFDLAPDLGLAIAVAASDS